MRDARQLSRYVRYTPFPSPYLNLDTSRDIDEEILASLSFHADVPKAGHGLLRAAGHSDATVDKAYRLLQAFLRQSVTSYRSAVSLDSRARPLLFYYAFLNLAKAIICTKNLSFFDVRSDHGLTHAFQNSPLSAQKVSVRTGGGKVFAELYHVSTGQHIANKSVLGIADLLGYCTDIAHEVLISTIGIPSISNGMFRIAIDNSKQAFGCLAIANAARFFDRLSLADKQRFENTFDSVVAKPAAVRLPFDLLAQEAAHYQFFETRNTWDWSAADLDPAPIIRECAAALIPHVSISPYASPRNEFPLFAPLNACAFSESLAIYAVTFYLSSLVRYNPEYLEAALSSVDGWLLNQFAQSASSTGLRYLSNQLLQEHRIYRRR